MFLSGIRIGKREDSGPAQEKELAGPLLGYFFYQHFHFFLVFADLHQSAQVKSSIFLFLLNAFMADLILFARPDLR